MALYGNLRDYRFTESADDVRGSEVRSSINDDKLGKIDDVLFDHSTGDIRHVVVDTGGWLSSKKFLVPSREISVRQDEEDRDHYFIGVTKEQIERFPAFDEKTIEREDEFSDYEKRYQKAWDDGPVMHKKGSTHILTPEAGEMGASTGGGVKGDFTPQRIAREMPIFGAISDSNSADEARLVKEDVHSPTEQEQPLGSQVPSGRVDVDNAPGDRNFDRSAGASQSGSASNLQPYGRERFLRFQERLRKDREAILRHRGDKNKAA